VEGAEAILAALADVRSTRERVAAQTMTVQQALGYYTGIINTILDRIGAVSKEANTGRVGSKVSGFHAVLNMKEAAGIERALIATTFADKQLPWGRLQRIIQLAATQDANAANFRAFAAKDQRAVLDEVKATGGYATALTTRGLILRIGQGAESIDTLNREPVAVFAEQSVKLDELKKVEDKLGRDMLAMATDLKESAWAHLVFVIVRAALVFALTVFAATILVRAIVSNVREAVGFAQDLGEGKLNGNIPQGNDDEIGQLLNALGATQQRLTDVISEIQGSSLELDSGVNEIAHGNQHLSERTQAQAVNLEKITKKMHALSDMVSNSSGRQSEGDNMAEQALKLTTKCSEMVKQLYFSMQEIRDSSKNIMTITSVIDEIAFQTNLLSLNAAVEAARAGEQGKGFAVVAAEVRQLAQRSSSAASEINELIDTGVNKVSKGGELAETARNSLNEVQDAVRSVSDVMRELSQNSHDQATDINKISDMLHEIETVTQQNTALVEEVAAASEMMNQSSSGLSEVTKFFALK
ncbi:MAG: methyl-accepting chemotaxis protein, partial [Pseudomonadota bacterium]